MQNNNIQQMLLKEFKEKGGEINIYLITGIKLTGIIKAFDDTVLILKNSSKNNSEGFQMVYKQSISTLSPVENSNVFEIKDISKENIFIDASVYPIILNCKKKIYSEIKDNIYDLTIYKDNKENNFFLQIRT